MEPMTHLKVPYQDAAGNTLYKDLTEKEEIEEYQRAQWSKLYQLNNKGLEESLLVQNILNNISNDETAQVPEDLCKTLSKDSITHPSNIKKAIKLLKETSSGQEGLSLAFWEDTIETSVKAISTIFKQIIDRGQMTQNMCEAVTTLIYIQKKGRKN